jgi:hypothetical protein
MVHNKNGSACDEMGNRGRGWRQWAAAIVLLLNALTSAAFSVVALVSPASLLPEGGAVNELTQRYAMYTAARSLPLAVVAIALVVLRAPGPLAAIALVLALVQSADVLVGLAGHDLGNTLGPAVLAALTFAAWVSLRRASTKFPSLCMRS